MSNETPTTDENTVKSDENTVKSERLKAAFRDIGKKVIINESVHATGNFIEHILELMR